VLGLAVIVSGLGARLPVVPMPVRFGPLPVGAHNSAAGTGPGDDVGKRVPRQQGLAAVTAVQWQQTVRIDGRWQHKRPARPALERVHCIVADH
jgi:hypothetical protein